MGMTDKKQDTGNPAGGGRLEVAEGLGLGVSHPLKPAPYHDRDTEFLSWCHSHLGPDPHWVPAAP